MHTTKDVLDALAARAALERRDNDGAVLYAIAEGLRP